ncbi:MAG TPA: hypothetical protein VLI55_11650 [Bryobacteraceae bacterium]|nr:hypothetical protein [Bryobacteraceae bacterium]
MSAALAGVIESPGSRSEARLEDRPARSKFEWKLLLLAVAAGAILENGRSGMDPAFASGGQL